MRPPIPVLLALLACVACGPACANENSASGSRDELPADVAGYVERRAGCNHWGGEDAYDKARGQEIAAALRRLDCDAIDSDERHLRHRHANSPGVLKAIEAALYQDG